ncbi:hypothetical protein DVA67_009270 [Solirubrobacter sp. CPCC 204708]|uniref:Phospholipase C/D domain-containing protein n=1 Tax=Solirubrobacter deserti TaxID=2282478 RepID=A0ABT4REF5_9ACTN|nr:zinc dependent phospholipase C family protein [Solirubrobacter deserti]MBE2316164.1 hypothetical protein [Solirubrobacter deserti]MDA0136913.1 hypothetical protein [Solirubrobacter deserti]
MNVPLGGRLRPLVAACAAALFAVLALASTAHAFKPYTHVQTGLRAYEDVMDDGKVTIEGREYAVKPEVVEALEGNAAYFNAGVVGPDGFPDLVMGQSVIHPEQTGKWLAHILKEAYEAQSDPAYSGAERKQILAFAYGYLTHAAGDMWAHTLVNDVAGGVFPSVGELADIDEAEIAIRHIIVEGYIGDATEGYDGNKARGPVQNEVNEDGNPQVSDDATPHIPFAAPKRFIYETFINPANPLPEGESRGRLIDFFLDMQAELQVAEARFAWDSEYEDCLIADWDCYERTKTLTVQTVRGPRTTEISYNRCEAEYFCALDPGDLAADLTIDNLVETYLEHWIEDIEDGLKNWSDLGLATTKALFDPRSHRAAQDHICRNEPDDEYSLLRANCEDGVGPLDVIGYEAEDYINHHLISMLGAPDIVGDLNELFGVVSDTISDVLGPALNPLQAPIAELKEFAKGKIQEAIEEELRIDIDQLKSFVTSPTHWIGIQSVGLDLPIVGPQQVDLFQPGTHEKLDALMHLPADHHEDQEVDLPGVGTVPSTGLKDSAVFDAGQFAAYRNAVQTAKLLLLDGNGLNAALGDILKARGDIKGGVATYPANGNLMTTQLSGPLPWLRSIDSDHSWRHDGRPRYCEAGATGCPSDGAQPRPAEHDAGNDTFPVWESCLLRPTFATLYRDWENGTAQFPALGDAPSADPSDTDAPAGTLALAGTTYTAGGTTYVGGNHTFTAKATDAVFTDSRIGVQYRYYKAGSIPGAWKGIAANGTFVIPAGAGDGTYHVQLRTADPCHTFDPSDELEAGAPVTRTVVLDTTAPQITITKPSPEGVTFDSDDFSAIEYTATDAASGVDAATVKATFDGAPATHGQVLDMFLLAPGAHSVKVAAADNLGNATDSTRTFELHATIESLLNNIARSCDEGLIGKQGTCKSLSNQLSHAPLGAFVNHVQAQRGKSIDVATANRLIAFAQDLL